MLRRLITSGGESGLPEKFRLVFTFQKFFPQRRQFNRKSAGVIRQREVAVRGRKTIGFWVTKFPRAECHRGFTSTTAQLSMNSYKVSALSRF